MDGHNDDIYSMLEEFEPLEFPLNVDPQVMVAPAPNPPVGGAVPPVVMAAPAANPPAVGAVPPVMMAAPAGNVPLAGAVPPEMAAAPAGDVPAGDADPAGMAAPAWNMPTLGAVPISVVPPAVVPGDESGVGDTSGRKKRGRPRKYDADGNLIAPSGAAAAGSGKKGRGRAAASGSNLPSTSIPSLSGEGHNLPLAMVGWGFIPHVMTADIGEDVAVKIARFATQNGQKGISVLSASGTVSNVSIRQLGVSGGVLRYEGLFQIMALSGSFSAAADGIRMGRAGALTVALSGPDGRVIGGAIAGTLVAASPIIVLIGTFVSSDWLTRKGKDPIQEPDPAPPSAPGPSRGGTAPPGPPVNPGANIFASPM